MKRIFWIMMCLVVCAAAVMAEEAVKAKSDDLWRVAREEMKPRKEYQAFLERDPEYVRIQNELNDIGLFASGSFSLAYNDGALRTRVKECEKKMRENRVCAAAEDLENLALVKERFLFLQKDPSPFFDINEAPKKDIPGSPEFQYAMYVIDKINEEGAEKWKQDAIHAKAALLHNLQRVAFDDPEWRKLKFEEEYAGLACSKRGYEWEHENIDAYIQFRVANYKLDFNRVSPETKQKYQQLSDEWEAKKETDSIYKKLWAEYIRLSGEQEVVLGNFTQKNSDFPAVTEYLTFNRAVQDRYGKL